MFFKKLLFFVIVYHVSNNLCAQTDSLIQKSNEQNIFPVKVKQLIIPTILMGYGLIGLESHSLISLNGEIRDELRENIDRKLSIDDFSQYTPTLSVYALNAVGIKGKHNLKQRLIISATSHLIMGLTVNIVKNTGTVTRPDASSDNSFPSGHTAMSFVGAEFLWQEYKDVSIWYGITGYLIASGTGFFRMYNDKHWLTDVAMGAGIGILSTKIGYWTYPYIEKTFFKNSRKNNSVMISPFYNGKQTGLSLNVGLTKTN